MNQVWIMETGEDHMGGCVLGVYADKDLAFADFAIQAAELDSWFSGRGIDAADQAEDGRLYLHAGCDWLSLTPHQVITVSQLPARV